MQKNQCEMPRYNENNEEIKKILTQYKNIAIVGLSKREEADSHQVAKYLIEQGYNVIPVNPTIDEILGRKSYPDLKSVPVEVEIVDIFRKPQAVPDIVDMAIEKKAKVVWMQLGIANNEAAKKALDNGLKVVQNKCIKIEHQRYFKNDNNVDNNVTINLNL